MISSIKKHYPLFILLCLALLTRFLFLSYPAEVVFDEVHFGKFVSAYSTQQYYFDIHPPLGKLMIAGFARLNNIRPDVSFEQIGQAVSAKELFVLRFLPALFGSLLVLVFYQLALVLGLSKKAAFLAGWLVLFDNAFLVESKFILVDSFLFFFGFSSLLVFLHSRKQENRTKKYLLYFLSMILAGLAFSIKWTGLSFWGLAMAIIFLDFFKTFFLSAQRGILLHSSIPKGILKALIFLTVPFLIYVLPFVVHFRLLDESGPGDAFMGQAFQKTLIGGSFSDGSQLSFWDKFSELNRQMYFYNSTLTKEHADGSRFYEWPWLRKPVWYWSKSFDGQAGNIYLWGNPLVWSLGLVAVLAAAFSLVLAWKKRGIIPLLLLGWLANLLPFLLVGRVAFLYHYLPALGFAILLFALVWERFCSNRTYLFWGLLLLVFLSFLIVSPISFGFLVDSKLAAAYQLLAKIFH